MSAIWGAVCLKGQMIPDEVKKTLRNAYNKSMIDRYEELDCGNVYMGCGIQYFTPESLGEKLPCKDSAGNCFTADVVLDNRTALCQKLVLGNECAQKMPDGEILCRYYQKFGQNGLIDLLGVFAFAYYDRGANQLIITTDSMGDRGVYYTQMGDVVYFSTLIQPLVALIHGKLNDRWITDFLAMDHLFVHNEARETPYANIYRVEPAHSMTFRVEGISAYKYWDPFQKLKALKYKTDEEYKEHFRKLFRQAVTDVMRSNGETSILLSAGYDSNAVASIAAPELKKRGKKLYSYTSVPTADYKDRSNKWHLDNEQEAVEKTAAFFGNLEPEFVDMPGVNGWNGHEKEMTIMEMPYKSVQNMLWIPESMRKAYASGARIMLNGSFGNTTISYSSLKLYFNELYRRKHLLKLYRELRTFQKIFGFTMKQAAKNIIIAKAASKRVQTDYKTLFGNSYVNKKMIEATGAQDRMITMNRKFAKCGLYYEDAKGLMIQDIALRQIGEATTKHSLATGVLLRDPTKDRRVVEFCLSIPVECYSRGGEDRRLVSVYLKDLMPPHILQGLAKGRQSADMHHRISLQWPLLREEWMKLYKASGDSKYVNTELALKDLTDKSAVEQNTQMDFGRHIYTLMILELEKQLK